MILNLQVQGWSDLGVSRRTAAQDGLSGTLGLQQGKGMFLHFCIFAFPYFFNWHFCISSIVHLCFCISYALRIKSSGMEYRWRSRRIQKDGGKGDDLVLVQCSIIEASSIEKLSAIHMIQRVIKLSYYICARIFNHSMERHRL